MSILTIIATNHNKTDLMIGSIVNIFSEIKEKYIDDVRLIFISSSETPKQRELIEKNKFIESYFVDENYKKFKKLKYLWENKIIKSDEYIQILDADDYIVSDLLFVPLLSISKTNSDIILNNVFKIDPILYKNEVKNMRWSGVSSNTIYKVSVLDRYFRENDYDHILSEDNIRHLFALLECKKIQRINSPYYIGIRWWKDVISNSSYNNCVLQFEEAKQTLKILKKLSGDINSVNLRINKKREIFYNERGFISCWAEGTKEIKSEIYKKIFIILKEYIFEYNKKFSQKKQNGWKKELKATIRSFSSKRKLHTLLIQSKEPTPNNEKIDYNIFCGKIGSLKFKFVLDRMEFKYDK